jgi:preprotein translocase subunit SecF
MIRVTLPKAPPRRWFELRESVGALGYGEPIIQQFGKPNEVSIRMKLPEGSEQDSRAGRHDGQARSPQRQGRHPDARIDGVDSVSGKVSGELFGTGMALAGRDGGDLDLHLDPVRMAIRRRRAVRAGPRRDADHGDVRADADGVRSQHRRRLLTLIGYSLNDTIVVYDRIRENLKKVPPDADARTARSVGQRNAVAHDRHLAFAADHAARAAAAWAGR